MTTAAAMTISSPRAVLAWRLAVVAIAAGVSLAPYLSWRPFEELFTVSDIFFLIGLALLIGAGRLPMLPLGRLTLPWMFAFALMMTALFVSSLVNGDLGRWLAVALQFGFALLVLPLVLIGHDDRTMLRLGKALILGVVAMEALGIAVYFYYAGDAYEAAKMLGPEFITGGRRLAAFLADANSNGAVIATTLPFVLHLRRRGAIGGAAAAAAFAVLGTALVLAASFTAFSAGLFSLLLYSVIAGVRPSLRVVTLAATAATALVVLGVGLPQAFGKRIAPALEHGDIAQAGSFVGRLDLIREAWVVVDGTVLIGLGVDQYRVVSVDKMPVHQSYLLMWAEGGIFAMIGWLLIVMITVATGVMALRHDRADAGLALAVTSTFIIASTASPHMYARSWIVPVVLAMGFAVAAQRRGRLIEGDTP